VPAVTVFPLEAIWKALTTLEASIVMFWPLASIVVPPSFPIQREPFVASSVIVPETEKVIVSDGLPL